MNLIHRPINYNFKINAVSSSLRVLANVKNSSLFMREAIQSTLTRRHCGIDPQSNFYRLFNLDCFASQTYIYLSATHQASLSVANRGGCRCTSL